MKNADVTVAGPFNISGTAALVGAMEAYENMTGDVIQPDNVEAATNELVVTSELGEVIGDQEKAEELIGAVKDIIVAEEIQDPELIEEKVSETADKLEVSLSEEDKQQIVELMQKIADLDLDIDSLKQQAKELYDKLGSLGVDLNISKSDVDGFLPKWVRRLKSSGTVSEIFSPDCLIKTVFYGMLQHNTQYELRIHGINTQKREKKRRRKLCNLTTYLLFVHNMFIND